MSQHPVDAQPEEQPVQLREYLAVLRARKWSILLVTLVTVGAALAFSFRQTPMYESEARVLINPANLTAVQPGTIVIPERGNLGTEKELVASEPVAQRVAEDLGIATTEGLTDDLTVEVVTDTEIIVIAYQHPEPLEAQRRSQAFAAAYLEFRREQVLQDVLAATEADRAELKQLQNQLDRVNEQIAQLESERDGGSEAERGALEGQRQLLISRITELNVRVPDVDSPGALRVGQVVQPAGVGSIPVSPDHVRNGLLALFVGLALGVGVAFLRERLDDRLRGRVDLENRTAAPVLAVVPRVSAWKKAKQAHVVTVTEPKSAASEAYRTLRTGLQYLASQEDLKSVLITSPHQDEGKTATAANLGVALANAGKRTVIVSADMRKPRLHKFFDVGNGAGLSSILTGEMDGKSPTVQTGIQDLWVVPSGPVPSRPAEMLGSERMGMFLDWLRQHHDFVILDAAPTLIVSDALTLAPLADAVLMVADAETTTRGAVTHARDQLAQVNARVVGAVLNNFDPSKAKAYPYYYQYYYTYRYEDEPAGRRGRRG